MRVNYSLGLLSTDTTPLEKKSSQTPSLLIKITDDGPKFYLACQSDMEERRLHQIETVIRKALEQKGLI